MNHAERAKPVRNPFTVVTPEKLGATEAQQLFVEVFSDFPEIKRAGHSLIQGARGSGKSMMFRCLRPDVIMLQKRCDFSDLPFLGFHISIKNTELRITDLGVLERHHASFLINEHFLVVSILIGVLRSLVGILKDLDLPRQDEEYKFFLEDTYKRRLRLSRSSIDYEFDGEKPAAFFGRLHNHALELHAEFLQYLVQLDPMSGTSPPPYQLPLMTFQGFFIPVLEGLKDLPGFPDCAVYLLIDDADNLSLTQTKILNSWLATRTQPSTSLKVSAQIKRYKSFVSPNGTAVESPHDYQEVNISDRYTTSKTSYSNRVQEIVDKRLTMAGFDADAMAYFPTYEKQEEQIRDEAERLRVVWKEKGRGHRPGDDALRYARPNFIRALGGSKKARSKYSYSGFDQLVHLSSGVIRYFLDSAALMFDTATKELGADRVAEFIPSRIQNEVARRQAEKTMFSRFAKLARDEDVIRGELGLVQKLQNLVFSMGKTFHEILVSDRSERRVFSIALSNLPDKEVRDVLDYGVHAGYLHEATIGNKDGTGRTWLYILNRCLAPQFNLDPTGFAGYLFVTNDALKSAMHDGKPLRDLDSLREPEQLILFD